MTTSALSMSSSGTNCRDTKQSGHADRTVVTFTPEAWHAFTATLR